MMSYKYFGQILAELSEQVWNKIQPERRIDDALFYSIQAWCKRLELEQEVTYFLLQGSQDNEVKDLINYFSQEWKPKKEKELLGFTESFKTSQLHNYVEKIFNRMNIQSSHLQFILLVAFVITAVGSLLYLLNQEKKQQNNKASYQESVTDFSSRLLQEQKRHLVLVINALKSDIVETLKRKERIESDDCEVIYRATESLWLGSETKISPKLANCFSSSNQFRVLEGEESEYDVYLVHIELKEADDGFKQGVDQLTRIDAFRRLADLAVKVKVSPRLRVEAYENTGVYSR